MALSITVSKTLSVKIAFDSLSWTRQKRWLDKILGSWLTSCWREKLPYVLDCQSDWGIRRLATNICQCKIRCHSKTCRCLSEKKGRLTIQCDEMWSFVSNKGNKQWIWRFFRSENRRNRWGQCMRSLFLRSKRIMAITAGEYIDFGAVCDCRLLGVVWATRSADKWWQPHTKQTICTTNEPLKKGCHHLSKLSLGASHSQFQTSSCW